MIYIKQHISDVTMTFDSAKIIATLPHVHSQDAPVHGQVPVDLSFNEGWTVTHPCSCTDGRVSFSRSHNWNFVNRLSSRYCTYIFLESLAMVFDSLRVLESTRSDITFVTTAEFDDAAAPVYRIPQIDFNHYGCEACRTEFLCRLSEGQPLPADAHLRNGKEGRLLLHEIVEIGDDGNADFRSMWRAARGYEA